MPRFPLHADIGFGDETFHLRAAEADGDLSLTADVAFSHLGDNPRRKAVLTVRQSLAPDAACAAAILHDDGRTQLQWRPAAGESLRAVQTATAAPTRLRLEKRGRTVRLFVGEDDAFSGAAAFVELDAPFLVGLGVGAQDDGPGTVVFSRVALETPADSDTPGALHSTLEVLTLATGERRVVHTAADHFEAPNWMPDGRTLLVNRAGRLYTVPIDRGGLHPLDTGHATRCNNDHGISPDGTRIVVSHHDAADGRSRLYTLPIDGGEPVLVTPNGPSYWHGWSPDGRTLVYCAERDGDYDVFAIPADGSGPEVRLTDAPGLDDGPEFSPDGAWIFFNSVRTGRMQIWRMRPDGSEQEQAIFSDRNDWFAHPSPDGRWLLHLSYGPEVVGHPPEREVELRLTDRTNGATRTVAHLYGGQGTLNVPCWSPDSRQVAFVSYQRIP